MKISKWFERNLEKVQYNNKDDININFSRKKWDFINIDMDVDCPVSIDNIVDKLNYSDFVNVLSNSIDQDGLKYFNIKINWE